MTQSLDKNKIDEIKADAKKHADKKMRYVGGQKYSWSPIHYVREGYIDGATAEALKAQSTEQDYKEVLKDHDRLVGELDVIINGEDGAAKQASLCDIVGQMKDIFPKLIHDKDIFNKGYIRMILAFREVCEERDELKERLERMKNEFKIEADHNWNFQNKIKELEKDKASLEALKLLIEERDRYKEALEKITSIEEDYVNAFNIASEALTNPQTTKS